MQPFLPQSGNQIHAIGGDHTAFTGCNVLRRVEAEHRRVAQRAGVAAAISRPQGVGSVFDHQQSRLSGKVEDLVHLTRPARQMHDQNRPRARRACPDHTLPVDRPYAVIVESVPTIAREYGREFQARAAEELASLPNASAIGEMLSDYAVMRDQLRACD